MRRRRARALAEAVAELDAVVEGRVEYLLARGWTPADARAEALRRLGMPLENARYELYQSVRRRERTMQLRELLNDAWDDTRYAIRGLTRRPGFTAVAVLTLAVGIGATTAIFSAVDTIVWRPLPFPEPERLMKVSLIAPQRGRMARNENMPFSYLKYLAFRDAQTVFERLALFSPTSFNVTEDNTERISGEHVSAAYFATLGVTMARGSAFAPEEDAHPDAPKQVILADGYWKRHYGGDPKVVGRNISFDCNPYQIVGIAAQGFRGLSGGADVFVPITTLSAHTLSFAQSHNYSLVARRKGAVSREQAAAAVQSLGVHVGEVYPDRAPAAEPWSAIARQLDETRAAPLVKRALFVLMAAVALVLVIACVNIANLLIGRAELRRREVALRVALGAGRGRLARLFLTESLLLALAGGAAGVLVAWGGVTLLSRIDPGNALRASARAGMIGAVGFSSIHLDGVALGFALALTALAGLGFGLTPSLHARGRSLPGALRGGLRATDAGSRRLSGRRVLIVTEVALALVLLAGSGLMTRSLLKLLEVDPGFNASGVMAFRIAVPASLTRDRGAGDTRSALPEVYATLVERIRAIPGVTAAAFADCVPVSGGCNGTRIEFLDRPKVSDPSQLPGVGVHWVTPDWFAAMGVPLLRGRRFTDADREGAPNVVLVSERAAKDFWPDEDPIGKRVALGQGDLEGGAEVIGVVGNVRAVIDEAAKPEVYLSYYQSEQPAAAGFVRTSNDPLLALGPVRQAVHEVLPAAPVFDPQRMSARLTASMARPRFAAGLLALFAAIALGLAVMGIYGVMSFAVSQRTHEIGIRMALGADRSVVLRSVLGEGISLALLGVLIGLAGALAAARGVRALLFNVGPFDPVTYAGMVAVLTAAAIAACWFPARRATRVDPMDAIRAE